MKNELLRQARERMPSPTRPGQPMSRAELAIAVNNLLFPPDLARYSPFNANYVGKLENSIIRRPEREDYRRALRTALQVYNDDDLGFHDPRASRSGTVEQVNRRTWLKASASVSGAIATAPMVDLWGPAGDDLPRHVGHEHITQIVQAAEIFGQWDNTHGGAMARGLADDNLHRFARLLRAHCPPALHADLHTAIAQLAGVVGFMLFDAYHHDDAHNRFRFALQCAEIGGDWHQRAMPLTNMARQAIWCGQADDGLTYIETALVRCERLTATERAMLHTVRARALARLGPGRAQEALAAVGAADEQFAQRMPDDDPPWMRFYDAAQHHGDTAHALYDVAVQTALKTETAARLRYSVQHHGVEYARSRAISRTKLASLTMIQGDPREAAAIGWRALDDAGPVRSHRAADDLRTLHRLAGRHATISEVDKLRTRIHTTIGATP